MEKDPTPKPPKPKLNFSFYRYFSIGLQLVIAVAVLGYLGHLLDDWLKFSFPLFLLLGIIAGLTASVIKLLRDLNNKRN